jgi:hypothetical protein
MPAYLTHRIAGDMVLDQLDKDAIPHKKAFYLGCQGPDILFFRNYQPWKSARVSLMLGVAMHYKKVRESFEHALEFVSEYIGEDLQELMSYIAGMITHYSIDKNAHPFVFGKAGKDSARHNMIEFMWDSMIAKETWDIEADHYDFSSEINYAPLGEGICDWYCDVAKKIYDTEITPKLMHQAQRHYAKAKKFLSNLNIGVKLLLRFATRVMKFDTHSLKYPLTRNFSLFSKEEYKSMQGMITKGVSEAAEMIRFATEYFDGDEASELPEWFGDVDFSGDAAKYVI